MGALFLQNPPNHPLEITTVISFNLGTVSCKGRAPTAWSNLTAKARENPRRAKVSDARKEHAISPADRASGAEGAVGVQLVTVFLFIIFNAR